MVQRSTVLGHLDCTVQYMLGTQSWTTCDCFPLSSLPSSSFGPSRACGDGPRSTPACARAFISASIAPSWTEHRVHGHVLLQLSKTLQATVLLYVPFPSRLSTLGRLLHDMTTHPSPCEILAIDTMDGPMAQWRQLPFARRKHCLQPTSRSMLHEACSAGASNVGCARY